MLSYMVRCRSNCLVFLHCRQCSPMYLESPLTASLGLRFPRTSEKNYGSGSWWDVNIISLQSLLMDQNKHVGFLVPALTYPVFNTLTVSSEFFQMQVTENLTYGGFKK